MYNTPPLPVSLRHVRSKIYGGFDWKLSKFMHADEVASKELLPGPYFTGKTPTRVIMLSPALDLSHTRSLREFKRITAGLIQVWSSVESAYVHVACCRF